MRENKVKTNKGITLIALVITIIVLLILAGVSIAMLTGENGILTQATEAREETERAEAEERVKLAILGSYGTDGKIDGAKIKQELEKQGSLEGSIPGDIKFNGYEFKVEENGKVIVLGKDESTKPNVSIETDKGTPEIEVYSETENITIEDNYKNKIVIPAGFGIAIDSGNNVTEGIVIEDAEGQGKGNQFVWVPVGTIKNNGTTHTIELSRYEFASDGTPTKKADDEDVNSSGSSNASEYIEEETGTKGNTVAKDLEDFKAKTIVSGGYYIARYEASNNNGIAESKANKTTCTNITQQNAAIEAKEMYENETTFTSDLINSLAWDTALVYIQTFSGDEDYSMQTRLNTSKQNTGLSGDEKLKIYDMASNVAEWSTESSSNADTSCVDRGGNFFDSIYPSSHRYYHNNGFNGSIISFRTILYL